MSHSNRAAILRTLPPTPEAVDRLCDELRSGILEALPQSEHFAVELLLREALLNAVIHGVKGDERGEIRCEIERFPGGITMRVSDTGPGFDWRARLDATVAPRAESGRGIAILRRYASAFEFNSKGNSVQVTKVFHEGEENA